MSSDPFRARVNTDTLSPQAAAMVEQRTPANDASVAPEAPPEYPGDRDPSGPASSDQPRDGGTSQDVNTSTSGQGAGDKDAAGSSESSTSSGESVTTTTTTTTTQEPEPESRPKSKKKGRG